LSLSLAASAFRRKILEDAVSRYSSILLLALPLAMSALLDGQSRPRARQLGIAPGAGQPGALNAITDVPGVRVGQTTVVRGDTVRTGVTAVLPHPGNLFLEKVPGAVFVGNAFGKLAGSTQVEELGTIESPIVLTTTLSIGTALTRSYAGRSRSRGMRRSAR
jgi:D-aminopeptidase